MLAQTEGQTKHLNDKLKQYQARISADGAPKNLVGKPIHDPTVILTILDIVLMLLTQSEEIVVPGLLDKMQDQQDSRYLANEYLAVEILSWFGPRAHAALPALLQIPYAKATRGGQFVQRAILRIAGPEVGNQLIAPPDKPLDEYKYFIDSLVRRAHSGSAKRVRRGVWNPNYLKLPEPVHDTLGLGTEDYSFNVLLNELTPEQRELVARIVEQANAGGIFDALVFLYDEEYQLSRNGIDLDNSFLDATMYEDFISRWSGYPWRSVDDENN